MRFEWDDKKAAANLRNHGVSFGEATEVFQDPYGVINADAEHPYGEERFFVIGYSTARLLLVVFTERRGDVVRIISARLPTPSERRLYESQNG